jgi:hypothetical protein
MNLALGALILLLLIFPGILFRFSYLNGPYSRKNVQTSLSDELVLSLIPAFIIQTLSFIFVEYIIKKSFDIGLLVKLVSGNLLKDSDLALFERAIVPFFIFILIVCLLGYVTGKIARNLVQWRKWDTKYHSLKFNNEWYYLLSGKILDYPGGSGESGKVQIVQADVLVDSSEGTVIYSGILKEFYLSKTEGLDRIYLSNVYRRKLKDDKLPEPDGSDETAFDERYYDMPGDFFVIPYSQIKNINVTYYYTVEKE